MGIFLKKLITCIFFYDLNTPRYYNHENTQNEIFLLNIFIFKGLINNQKFPSLKHYFSQSYLFFCCCCCFLLLFLQTLQNCPFSPLTSTVSLNIYLLYQEQIPSKDIVPTHLVSICLMACVQSNEADYLLVLSEMV